MILVTQGVTGCYVLQADRGSDIAGENFFDLFTIVGVHLNHTAHTLFLALDRVKYRVTGLELTRVNPEEGQGSNERIGSDLERQSCERSIVVNRTGFFSAFVIHFTTDGFYFIRSWQIFDNGIQNGRNALVLERRATARQHDFVGQGTGTQARLDLFDGQLTALKILVHRSEEHTSELQSRPHLVCRLLLEK